VRESNKIGPLYDATTRVIVPFSPSRVVHTRESYTLTQRTKACVEEGEEGTIEQNCPVDWLTEM
jgi:hypothetical protein